MPQITWTPAELFAAAKQITRQRVIAQILDGHLNGVIRDSDWYVIDFEDEKEEEPDPDYVDQRLSVRRLAATMQRTLRMSVASLGTLGLRRASLAP